MSTELVRCKRYGSMPQLHTPNPYNGGDPFLNSQLRSKPEPYYRCEMCILLADKEKQERRILDWNREQERK